jgi:hypothetical protein
LSPAFNHHQPSMVHVYEELTFCTLFNEQILAPIRKYVHLSKITEISSKHISHLVLHIIISNDNFQIIVKCVEITMYWCIDALCIMLFYHHECHDTHVFCNGGVFYKIHE